MSAYAKLVERLLGIWVEELNEGLSPDTQVKWPDDWDVSEQSKMRRIMAAMIAEVLASPLSPHDARQYIFNTTSNT